MEDTKTKSKLSPTDRMTLLVDVLATARSSIDTFHEHLYYQFEDFWEGHSPEQRYSLLHEIMPELMLGDAFDKAIAGKLGDFYEAFTDDSLALECEVNKAIYIEGDDKYEDLLKAKETRINEKLFETPAHSS